MDNKIKEKTKQVYDAQLKLTDVIADLKSEVREVFDQNQLLQEENKRLRQKIEEYKQDRVQPTVVVPIKTDIQEPITLQKKEPVLKEKPPVKIQKKIYKEPSPILEFFLGKNIIAKIATILIFLGIISFGQLAYVEFLNDVGRVLLIFFTGAFVFGLAIFSERKNAVVFSNVFYGVSLFIVHYSFILAFDSFQIISNLTYGLLIVIQLIATIIYFRNKRYDFLDVVLLSFYFLSTLAFIVYGDSASSHTIIYVLLTMILSIATYLYTKEYFKEDQKQKAITFFIITVLYLMIGLALSFEMRDTTLDYIVFAFLLGGIGVFISYMLIIFTNKNDKSYDYIYSIISFIYLMISSLYIGSVLNTLNVITYDMAISLYILLTLIPIYIFTFINKKDFKQFEKFFFMAVSLSMFVYMISAGPLKGYKTYDFQIRNVILVVETLILYIFSKYSKQDSHRVTSYIFGGLSLLIGLNYYLSNPISFDNSLLIFSTIFMTISMLGINIYVTTKDKLHKIDNVFTHTILLLSLIPFVVTFTHDVLSTDNAYIMASVLLLFIGYRYFSMIKQIEVTYKKEFKLFVNAMFTILVLIINLKYFDHNFSMFEDVFKFMFMFVMNIYIVKSLFETYLDYKQAHTEEIFAVAMYGIGVFVQSMFIHNYINIEFDKVILSSYFLIASAIGILIGFRQDWSATRKIGLAAIYYSLAKFFLYDFYAQNLDTFVRMITYFILGFILLGISLLYAYLEKTYGAKELS